MTTTLSIEERLRRARGLSAVLARLGEQASAASNDAPSPAFWSGLASIAASLEEDIAAISSALDMHATERPAPTVFVER